MTKVLSISAILLTFIFCAGAQAQTETQQPYFQQYVVENGDTLYLMSIDELKIVAMPKFKNRREWKNYSRMVYNLPRVYPYAQAAKSKLAEMDARFAKITGKRQRKEYIKEVEKEMTDRYKSALKKLTLSQGKMLIKLINRQTETTVYQIVKEMKGGLSAFFWQSVAGIFGASLKYRYDKNGDDAILEKLVNIYEYGDYNELYTQVFGMGMEEHTKMLQKNRKKKQSKTAR
ncbi:MAG: DUF4294 domain-containing protein [Prevotellaceae bacterium]|jgi:hypothetical protein|nr:DUF4294 domain-containing protein [Prevotellaceae bacterium]